MKLPLFLSPGRWLARLEEWRWRVIHLSAVFWDDPRNMFFLGVFPGLHLTTLALLLFLAIQFQDNKGIYFTRVACLDRLAYKHVCTRYHTNGTCDTSKTMYESIWLRGEYLLGYINDQVESIFPDNTTLADNLEHTDLVGNLTVRQYRVSPRQVDSVLPGASASPEWSEDLQDLTPPDPDLFPFPSYNHTRSFSSKTTTYGYTPHAYVLMTSADTRSQNTSDIKNLTMGRVKALRDANWVDANSRAVVVQAAFHKQDDNVFVHLSIFYEKKGDYWKFTTKFLGARLTTYFLYPNEEALQQFAHTDKKMFVSKKSHLISVILPTVLVITLFELVFETPHLWRLQLCGAGLRLFLMNIILTVLQIITLQFASSSATHLKEEVDKQYGNFYNMDVYPLLRAANLLTNTVILQVWVLMLKQVYMPGYFHPVINDLLRRLRMIVPLLCLMMFFLIVLVCFFGALMTSREGWGSLVPASIEVYSTIITDPDYRQYHFIYYPLLILFLFLLVPLMISCIVAGAPEPTLVQEEVVTGPITPAQLKRRRVRLEVRSLLEKFLCNKSK
uniref:Polycystin domain-containing protein n=1 Tax=Scylla olivacea TaxID=85551 RepID=A0A0P4WBZ6_SCYOL